MTETIILPDGTKLHVLARMNCALGKEDVHKHGNHDQTSHGNWARGGASLARDIGERTQSGGSTTDVSPDRHGRRRKIEGGKIVSPYPERSKEYKTPMNATATAAAVTAYRKRNADLLAEPKNALGTWVDPDTGHLWLDVVTVVKSHEEASSIARAHNQIAYYDADTGKTVNTGGTGIAKGRLGGRRQRRGDRGRDRGATATLDPFGFGRLTKHGNHDQSSHGNWARVSGAGIDPESLPPKYRKAMERRAAKLGITPEMLDTELQKALDRGNKAHGEWYDIISERVTEMAERHGTDLGTAAGVIAAMSPAREFGKNMRDAEQVLEVIEQDNPFEATAEDVAIYNEKRDPKRPIMEPGTYRPSELDPTVLVGVHPHLNSLGNKTGLSHVAKAVAIAKGAHVDGVLSGPKVRSFYSNIANPAGNRATIDTWMYRIMTPPDHVFNAGKKTGTLAEMEERGIRTQDVYQGSPGALVGTGIPGNVGLYPMFVESVQRVAAKNGLKPHGVQAIVWEVARVDAGYKATDLEAYR